MCEREKERGRQSDREKEREEGMLAHQHFLFVYPLCIHCSIKLGVMEDTSNRTRLAKLLKFYSSNSDTEQTTLEEYVERMKDKQESIYFVAGTSRDDVSGLLSFLILKEIVVPLERIM